MGKGSEVFVTPKSHSGIQRFLTVVPTFRRHPAPREEGLWTLCLIDTGSPYSFINRKVSAQLVRLYLVLRNIHLVIRFLRTTTLG